MKAVPQPGSLAPLSEASEQTPVSEIETGDVSIGPGLMTEAPAETRPRVIVEQEQSND